MIVGCVFRFGIIIQLNNSFTDQSDCANVLKQPMDCLTGFHFAHNVFVTINYNFYLGVLIERSIVTLRTWRHPTEFAQKS